MMLCETNDVVDGVRPPPIVVEPEHCEIKLEPFPNRPILVKEGENVIKIHGSPSSSSSSITEFCTPIPIDTDTFVGTAFLLIAGNNTPIPYLFVCITVYLLVLTLLIIKGCHITPIPYRS